MSGAPPENGLAERALAVREPYRSAGQQMSADRLGMWLFLISEGMLFGAVFFALAVYHGLYPAGAHAATHRLDLTLGVVNTALLLTSSSTMALAVRAAAAGGRGETVAWLALTLVLGIAFEALKLHSWFDEAAEGLFAPGHGPSGFPLVEPGARMFFHLYFVSTGLHAVHLAVGILLVGGTGLGVAAGWLRLPQRTVTVEMAGLYWQFVDMVWIFLFPALYLVAR